MQFFLKHIFLLSLISLSYCISLKNEQKLEEIKDKLRANRKFVLPDEDEEFFMDSLFQYVSSQLSYLYFNRFKLNTFLKTHDDDNLSSIEKLMNFLNSEIVDSLINISESKEVFEEDEEQKKKGYPLCGPCHYISRNLHSILKKKFGFNLLLNLITDACSLFLAKDVCHDAIFLYANIVVDSILDHYVEPEFICTKLRVCGQHFVTLHADDYAKEVFKDKPAKEDVSFQSETSFKILHLTDTHTDPEYKVNAETECGKPYCCRDPATSSTKKPSGKWGFAGDCDLPDYTLESLIKTSIKELKPDFIIWTGDNDAHDVWELKPDTPINSTKIVANILNKNIDVSIYAAIGNHEAYPCDMFDLYDDQVKKKNS